MKPIARRNDRGMEDISILGYDPIIIDSHRLVARNLRCASFILAQLDRVARMAYKFHPWRG